MPVPQILHVPASASAPTRYVNILPSATSCASQQSNYIVKTQPEPQSVQFNIVQPQTFQPQSTMLLQPESIRLEQDKPKPQMKPIPLMQVRR
jgi:hypothetical protein